MAKVEPIPLIAAIHGKPYSNSDKTLVTNSSSGQVSTRKIPPRDFKKHPITEREKETNDKMRQLVAEYKRIKSDPEAYAQLVAERNKAPKESQSDNTYHYFLKTRMDEGKNSITIKIAKSKSSEDSFVEGMLRCQNREEADRLLLEFIKTLGYTQLADAYDNIVKDKK